MSSKVSPSAPVTLRSLRTSQSLTQAQLADKTGLSQSAISDLELNSLLIDASVRRYLEGLGAQVELVTIIDGDRHQLQPPEAPSEPKTSIKQMTRLGYLQNSLEALQERFPSGRARKGGRGDRFVHVNIAKPGLRLTVEAPKAADDLGVQLIADAGARKALGNLFRAIQELELPEGARLVSTEGKAPETGEKRSLGLWWTLAGSYAAQRAIRDACVEWWIEALGQMGARGGFKLL